MESLAMTYDNDDAVLDKIECTNMMQTNKIEQSKSDNHHNSLHL